MDFLRNWIVTIDFDRGRLDILSPDATRDPGWGEMIPFTYDTTGRMLVLATAGARQREPFLVDTGEADTGILDESVLSRLLRSKEARPGDDEKRVTMFGELSTKVIRLSQLSVGSFRHEDLEFRSGKQNALGLNYLRRYKVTFDFPGQRLYLAKSNRFAGPDRRDNCGLLCRFREKGLEVAAIKAGGPAKAAGIMPGDVIVRLAGKPVSDLKHSQVNGLLTTEGRSVPLTIDRGGTLVEITFTPREFREERGPDR
jgi:hypothetical protein